MTSSMALASKGLFDLTLSPSLTGAISLLSFAETTEEPGCGQVKRPKVHSFLLGSITMITQRQLINSEIPHVSFIQGMTFILFQDFLNDGFFHSKNFPKNPIMAALFKAGHLFFFLKNPLVM